MPSSEAHVNNWNSCEDEIFVWHVDVPAVNDLLLRWQQAVLDAGERTGILRVRELSLMEGRFVFDRDGYILDFLTDHPELAPNVEPEESRSRGVFVKYLDASFGAVPASRLEFYDREGQIAESWVSDMRSIGSAATLPESFHQPSVVLGGMDALPGEEALTFELAVTTDIFFPWNPPIGRPGNQPLDNTALAQRNGSRLNAFLAELQAATASAGGAWNPIPSYSRNRNQVDDNGFIILDAPQTSWQLRSRR
ncbi:hypothetical protein AB0L82_31195 [Nocardia sp. NPDC052001]|uniref:hypothetical protein n=1 Tax=Nocardia sp. NPDC052001 TaxID=3154853 RepID=UPI003428F018